MKYAWVFFLMILSANAGAETLKANGVELYYSIQGEGAPVLMLHGGMESSDNLSNQIDFMARHFQVIALDSRKHGRSPAPDSPVSYRIMMEDVVALLDHLGLEQVYLLGWSDGGITALMTAIHHPERIERLVMMGSIYHISALTQEQRDYFANYQWDGNENRDGFPGIFIDDYLKYHTDLGGFGPHIEEMARMWASSPTLTSQDLERITAKTLIVNGDHNDQDLDHVLSMYWNIKDSQLFIVPGATHFMHLEKPDLWNQVVHRFLTEEKN